MFKTIWTLNDLILHLSCWFTNNNGNHKLKDPLIKHTHTIESITKVVNKILTRFELNFNIYTWERHLFLCMIFIQDSYHLLSNYIRKTSFRNISKYIWVFRFICLEFSSFIYKFIRFTSLFIFAPEGHTSMYQLIY